MWSSRTLGQNNVLNNIIIIGHVKTMMLMNDGQTTHSADYPRVQNINFIYGGITLL